MTMKMKQYQWKTKRYKLHMDYDEMPWEREAYRLEN